MCDDSTSGSSSLSSDSSSLSTLEVAGEVVGEGDEDGSEVGVEWVVELDQALPGRQSQDFHCSWWAQVSSQTGVYFADNRVRRGTWLRLNVTQLSSVRSPPILWIENLTKIQGNAAILINRIPFVQTTEWVGEPDLDLSSPTEFQQLMVLVL